MKKILIIGSSGLLGSSLVKILESKYIVITVTRTSEFSNFNLDMSSSSASLAMLEDVNPDYIINLAALTDVEGCEKNIEKAYLINTKIAENVAKYSSGKKELFVIHISTDHLYDKEYSNESDVIIYNNYALTKYCAEHSYKSNNVVILRTNFFGKSSSQKSEGLCNSIYNAVESGGKLKLFSDVFFSPLSINTLCNVISICLTKKIPGLYNVGSKMGMSKEDFLKQFLTQSGITQFEFESVSVDAMKFEIKRPKDMRMDVSLFEKTYGYDLPTLSNEIESVANEFK